MKNSLKNFCRKKREREVKEQALKQLIVQSLYFVGFFVVFRCAQPIR
ncbi:hypothetical protein P20480_0446 [Pseudoalteromonas sp. BSi20480]|nr:hypothetical protein P20480_0446 [Pseudoalteromonas sp. BSi20480]